MGKSTPRKAPMIEREMVSVPFETVAIDLVGPFEKGRGGYRYLLTYVCMIQVARSYTHKIDKGKISVGWPS